MFKNSPVWGEKSSPQISGQSSAPENLSNKNNLGLGGYSDSESENSDSETEARQASDFEMTLEKRSFQKTKSKLQNLINKTKEGRTKKIERSLMEKIKKCKQMLERDN